MTDFILDEEVRTWHREREPVFTTHLQRRATTHEIVLVCTEVVATHVRFYDIEVRIDRLVADKAVPRAELTERRQIQRSAKIKRRYTINRRNR